MASHANEWFLRLTPCEGSAVYVEKEFTLGQLLAVFPTSDIRQQDNEVKKVDKLVDGGIVLGRKNGVLQSSHNGDVASPIVSRYHAQLTITPRGHVYLTDLGSLHGTHIHPNPSSSKEPIKLRAMSPVQLFDMDSIVLGKPLSSWVRYEPVKYRVTFRYPELGRNSSKGGDRKMLGTVTTASARSRFATPDNLYFLGKTIRGTASWELNMVGGPGDGFDKGVSYFASSEEKNEQASDQDNGPPDVEPIVTATKETTMSISSLVEPSNSPSGVYRVPESVLYQSDAEADLPRGTEDHAGSPTPQYSDDEHWGRFKSPRPLEAEVEPLADSPKHEVTFDFDAPASDPDDQNVDWEDAKSDGSPRMSRSIAALQMQAEMDAAMIIAERMVPDNLTPLPDPRPSASVPTDLECPLPPPPPPSRVINIRTGLFDNEEDDFSAVGVTPAPADPEPEKGASPDLLSEADEGCTRAIDWIGLDSVYGGEDDVDEAAADDASVHHEEDEISSVRPEVGHSSDDGMFLYGHSIANDLGERYVDVDEADVDTAYGRWYSYSSDEDSVAACPGTNDGGSISDENSDVDNESIVNSDSEDSESDMSYESRSRSNSFGTDSSVFSDDSDDEEDKISSGEGTDEEEQGDSGKSEVMRELSDLNSEAVLEVVEQLQSSLASMEQIQSSIASIVRSDARVDVDHLAQVMASSADKENIDPRREADSTAARPASTFRDDPSGVLDLPIASERTPAGLCQFDLAATTKEASGFPALCDTSTQTEPIPALGRTLSDEYGHQRTPSVSDASSDGPITPSTNPRKRALSDDFIQDAIDEDSAPPKKKLETAKPASQTRGIGSTIGLMLMGAAVGSAGTIWGLMQLAD
ncbi:hypothetical protein BCR39DRAFT_535588 [Naematelia encephala]|uniref:FHA domain-containing protein n=1 Tax=Naematelia encephala TaxID=71784 RepID=A0A1Y2B075_9TREE|nr:hypothetical protein BCR39DRAFT_535588 [Naematelia encephala]